MDDAASVSLAAEVRGLALAALHRRLGALMGRSPELPEVEAMERAPGSPEIAEAAVAAPAAPLVPIHYGSVAAEYQALRRGCGIVDRSLSARLELLGADRQRFLNAYVTCDVKSLTPGQGAYGFVTNAQGRILADTVVLIGDDRLWLELPPGREQPIAEHLRKYLIADRVEIRPLAGLAALSLIGPLAGGALAALLDTMTDGSAGNAGIGGSSGGGGGAGSGGAVGALPQAPWSHLRLPFEGEEATLQRSGQAGEPAWTILVPEGLAERLVERLLAQGNARPVGWQALEIWRAENGVALFGRDFGPRNFPQETGLESAVSYTKGCYLGQEVVARIHYRGGVQKTLRGLLFAAGPAPPPGTPLLLDGREAGIATTVVDSPALGRPIGLSILHRRAAAPGTLLELGTTPATTPQPQPAAPAEVRELPLVTSAAP